MFRRAAPTFGLARRLPVKKSITEEEETHHVVVQGKGAMPSYKGRVSDKDLEGVIAYIRTFAKR